jgi:hypothetical protein
MSGPIRSTSRGTREGDGGLGPQASLLFAAVSYR